MKEGLPNFFIAGVPKAGTSSLYSWLDDHPDAIGSFQKETCFFADPDTHVFRPDFNIANGLQAYRAAFPETGPTTRILFEATPTYIYSQAGLQHIPDLPTAPKCLFILREPASQIRSVFRYFRDNWTHLAPDMTFGDFIEALRANAPDLAGNELVTRALTNADYGPWLHAWQARLGHDRMRICTFDRLRENPDALVRDIAAWCDLDPSFYDRYEFRRENETYLPKNRMLQQLNVAVRGYLPKGRLYRGARQMYRHLNARRPQTDVDTATLQQLRREFEPANRRLAADFDLDLSGWMP